MLSLTVCVIWRNLELIDSLANLHIGHGYCRCRIPLPVHTVCACACAFACAAGAASVHQLPPAAVLLDGQVARPHNGRRSPPRGANSREAQRGTHMHTRTSALVEHSTTKCCTTYVSLHTRTLVKYVVSACCTLQQRATGEVRGTIVNDES